MKKFNLKKTTTAAIAATVGAVLLLGGAGTLAYWSDDAKTAQQTISSGELVVDDSTLTAWTVKNGSSDTGKTFEGTIVPGDTLTTTVNVPIKLVGQNIKGELVVAKNVQSTFEAANATVAVALGGVNANSGITAGATADKLTFAKPFSGNIPVTVTVTFPFGSTIDMNKKLEVGLNYTLTQK